MKCRLGVDEETKLFQITTDDFSIQFSFAEDHPMDSWGKMYLENVSFIRFNRKATNFQMKKTLKRTVNQIMNMAVEHAKRVIAESSASASA